MTDISKYAGQLIFYILIAALIGYFDNRPSYRQWPADKAQIKLGFTHGANRKIPCKRLTPEEISKLPPGERRPNTCTRERLPVRVQLLVDKHVLYDAILKPTGMAADGPSRAYRKFEVGAGRHTITARLTDSDRQQGFDYEKQMEVDLLPLQNLAIDFKADVGGFIFR